ncbi:MAG: hypothetical protein V2B13_15795 [Pseudomonadota bacterium]
MVIKGNFGLIVLRIGRKEGLRSRLRSIGAYPPDWKRPRREFGEKKGKK